MADPVFVDGVTPQNAANMNKLQTRDEKAAVNGYASLDGTGKVPLAQLPPLAPSDLLIYDGDFVARAYNEGEIVVYNGVAYLCVKPTSAAPIPWTTATVDLSAYQAKSEKNAANGYVGLNATSQIVLGGDANLYRSAAAALTTDGMFIAKNLVSSFNGTATQIILGNTGGFPNILFGSAQDTNLYREGPSQLRTDGTFATTGGLYFGAAHDTSLYRSAAGQLTTPGALIVSSDGGGTGSGLSVTFGGMTARWLQVGVPDSGGAGFRMVRIAN